MDLKSFREDKLKLTQAQFATLINEEQSSVSRWEKDPDGMSVQVIQKILEQTGASFEELTGWRKPVPQPLEVNDNWTKIDFTKHSLIDYIANAFNEIAVPAEQRKVYIDDLRAGVISSTIKPKVIIVGRSDTGKSTLINALLGVEKMPTSWTPTTAIAVYIKHISDKPSFIEEDVWVFANNIGGKDLWDEGRLNDETYCRQWKIGAGGVEILRSFGTRQGDYYSKNADAAVVFLDAPVLNTCDIVDLPGFGTDAKNDDSITFRATQQADVIIYLSQSNGFMRIEDITYLKENISRLPILEKKGDNDFRPLANLFVVASQAHVINNGNKAQLDFILDTGCESLIRTLSDGYWNTRSNISGYDVNSYRKNGLRSRFFVYTTDILELCMHFNHELKNVLEALPIIIDNRAKTFVREYVKTHKPALIAEIDKYEGIANEREKYVALIKEIDRNELTRVRDNDMKKKHIIDEIQRLKSDSINSFSEYCSVTINTDNLVSMLKNRKIKSKKEEVEQFCSYLQSTIQEKCQEILTEKSEVLSESIKDYINLYSDGVSKAFTKIGLTSDFNTGLSFVNILSKLGIIGGVGVAAAGITAFVVGNYAIIAAILGGAQFLVRPMFFFPPLIGVGVIISILSAITLWVIKAVGLWEKSAAKKIVAAFDENEICEKFRTEINEFWDRTQTAFQQVAKGLDDKWALYVNDLNKIVESYDVDEIQHKIASLKGISDFFDNIPL